MSKYVVFDVDDVICPSSIPLQKALTLLTGKDIPLKDWYDFQLTRVYDVPFSVIEEAFHVSHMLETDMHDFTSAVFQAVRDAGMRVGVLTARSWHPHGHEKTLEKLEQANARPDKLLVCSHSKSKADYIQNFGEVALYIDDNASHIHDVSAVMQGTTCLLRNNPWNLRYEIPESRKNVHRVSCASEIVKFLPD